MSRRLEHLKFEPGVIDEVLQFLRVKIAHFKDIEKECSLFLDEMAITSGDCFNNSNNSFWGHVTFPRDTNRKACQALVLMLTGIASRWKQVVAYHFTDKSLSGNLLTDYRHN